MTEPPGDNKKVRQPEKVKRRIRAWVDRYEGDYAVICCINPDNGETVKELPVHKSRFKRGAPKEGEYISITEIE